MNTLQAIERLRNRGYDWPIPWESVELIARSEGCILKAYLCPAGKPTIGWGETDGVSLGDEWTEDTADARFLHELKGFTDRVQRLLKLHANPYQLGAMVSLAYNIGLGGFAKSTVLRAHNSGDYASAARAFNLWNKARVNGVLTVLPGLVSRRASEAALYLKPEDHTPQAPNAQAVESESPMQASPIVKAGATTTTLGGLAGVTAMLDGVTPILEKVKGMASTLSVDPLIVLSIALLATGANVIYWRYKQRKEGWA